MSDSEKKLRGLASSKTMVLTRSRLYILFSLSFSSFPFQHSLRFWPSFFSFFLYINIFVLDPDREYLYIYIYRLTWHELHGIWISDNWPCDFDLDLDCLDHVNGWSVICSSFLAAYPYGRSNSVCVPLVSFVHGNVKKLYSLKLKHKFFY